jgi:hypothetical protein
MRLAPTPTPRVLAVLATVAAISGAACGDDDGPGRDQTCTPLPLHVAEAGDDMVDRLRTLPGVDARAAETALPGYQFYEVTIDQPVDHDDPCAQRFTQHLTFIHRSDDAPMVLASTGYANYMRDRPFELTSILAANQLVVEHRYFADSRPSPADWQFLDIRQAAADHHRIVQLFRPLFPGAWLSTGGSKGGMTSIFHRRFYPDDVDATVPYVAPINRGNPDPRYDAFVDNLGPADCRAALRALQVEMLQNRRAELEERARAQAAAAGYRYTRVAVGPAVESAIASLEWSFWQYHGVGLCSAIPAVTASNGALAEFLDEVSPVSSSADGDVEFFEPYVYQVYDQLGYPGTVDTHLEGLLLYTGADYHILPEDAAMPTFDPTAMDDIVAWFQADAERFLLVYGEWDPWTAGRLELGAAGDALSVTVAQGTHGAGVDELAAADRTAALDRLEAWTGTTIDRTLAPTTPRARLVQPRLPAAVVQAWKLAARR